MRLKSKESAPKDVIDKVARLEGAHQVLSLSQYIPHHQPDLCVCVLCRMGMRSFRCGLVQFWLGI